MVSQNVLNLVDALMVGQLGDTALAAVGVGGLLNFVTAALLLGISAGVQAMAARRIGEGKPEVAAHPLNGGLLLAVVLAIPWSFALSAVAPSLFAFATDDANVVATGVPYLRWRLGAMTFLCMNFAFRGFWNATERTGLYMGTLVFMHTCNIAMNAVFIFGLGGAPELGAEGAGLASALSTGLGTLAYIVLGFRFARGNGFLDGLPSRETLRTMVRVSLPAGIQQAFFAAGLVCFQAIVGKLGTREQAATHVLIQLLLVGVLPGLGFGLASGSLVGQALGRGDPDDASRWAWQVTRMAMALVFLLSLPAILVPEWLLKGFLHDPETLAIAVAPMRLLGITLALDTVGSVLMNSLLGAGDARRVMSVSITLQWLLFLPLAYCVGPVLGLGLFAVFSANVLYRMLQSAAFVVIWRRGGWKTVEV